MKYEKLENLNNNDVVKDYKVWRGSYQVRKPATMLSALYLDLGRLGVTLQDTGTWGVNGVCYYLDEKCEECPLRGHDCTGREQPLAKVRELYAIEQEKMCGVKVALSKTEELSVLLQAKKKKEEDAAGLQDRVNYLLDLILKD